MDHVVESLAASLSEYTNKGNDNLCVLLNCSSKIFFVSERKPPTAQQLFCSGMCCVVHVCVLLLVVRFTGVLLEQSNLNL